ncbi:DUF4192 family protein [Cellulomonas sp. ATA003]|uniref:DUF4192 family protein n=1 Tax=Cellulomonas sp. ATA003 TaxID=3073064 RepID=UPI002872D4E5|nr:DUF4192 family protein [Cellulomonas sp. ATA003]WNB84451.1 DUF4192 family protein [Cellulomonas sp. ATA003]
MDATTIRVREPRELLALLPYQLGFRPERSAVAVALRPPRGRVGLIARVDLADLADPDLGPQLARRLVTHLVGDGAANAVLVVYADDDPRAVGAEACSHVRSSDGATAEAPGETPTAVQVFRAAAAAFLGDVAVWVVAPSGYLSLDCVDADCCPPGGRPLRDLESTEVGAHMVLAGAMVADSREALVPDVPASAAARRNATRAAARRLARRVVAEEQGPAAVARWRGDGLLAWRQEVDEVRRGGRGPDAAALGRLAAVLADVPVRDAVLLTLVAGAGDLPERSLHPSAAGPGGVGVEVAQVLGAVVSPRDGVPPDPDLHVPAARVLELVVSHAAGPSRAPALTLLGLLAWWSGDGARAGVLLDRALAVDPSYRLAHLLGDALAAGLAPGWVRTRGDGHRADVVHRLRYGRGDGGPSAGRPCERSGGRMTIVVGYLATREGRAALDAAIAEAERRSTRLLVVLSGRVAPASDGAAAEQARQTEDLRALLDGTGVPYDIREVSEGRDVAEDLISAAEENAGVLIVIGLRRRSPVGKLILGVNAQRILLDAPCPVLAVKPSGNGDPDAVVRSE